MGPTISIIQQPYKYSPVNSELWYVTNTVDTSDTELQDFKYLYRVYSYDRINGSTLSYYGTYKIPSRPTTGDGLFTPHRLLKSDMGNYYTFSFTQSGVQPIVDDRALLLYNVEYGTEYNPSLTFSATNLINYNSAGITYSLLGLSMSYVSTFNVNDNIFIDKVNKQINQYYDGPGLVVGITGSILITNITFGVTQSNELGVITSLGRYTGEFIERYAYNGTRQYNEIDVDFGSRLLVGSASGQFLSNYNGYKEIFTNQYETLGFMYNYSETGVLPKVTFKTYDINFNLTNIGTQSLSLTQSYIRYEYGVGTNNLSSGWSFSTPSEGYYSIQLSLGSSTYSTSVNRKVINNCSIYDNVRLMFLNRLGSFEFWNFNMDSKRTTTIQRTEFNKILAYNYRVGDRGNTILGISAEDSYTINTDWVSESDIVFLSELVTSSEVFVIDEVTLNRLPIIITGPPTYEYKTTNRDKLFNLSVNFKFSYNMNLQNN